MAASTETDDPETLARDVTCPASAVSVLFDELTKLASDVLYAVAIALSMLDEELETFLDDA
jgi:hypothetical protein